MGDDLWGMNLLSGIFKNYGIRCIGVGSRRSDESEITLTLALYEGGEELAFDSRLTSTMIFHTPSGPMRLCMLYPGSGCGVVVENGAIVYAEDGPNGFAERGVCGLTGKQVLVLAYAAEPEELAVIFWHQEPKIISSDDLGQIVKRMRELDRAFC